MEAVHTALNSVLKALGAVEDFFREVFIFFFEFRVALVVSL